MNSYIATAIFAVLGGISLYFAKYLVKAGVIRYCIDMEAIRKAGSRASFQVRNRSWFSAEGASLMVTIEDMSLDDVLDHGDTRWTAYICKNHLELVRDAPTCWSFAHYKNPNPPTLDLLSKQVQSAALFNLHENNGVGEMVELSSESCFYDPNIPGTKSMVFLKWHSYRGRIKFFSKDSLTKEFEFQLDPDNREWPLTIYRSNARHKKASRTNHARF